jgi:hypothetical protein
MFQAQVAATIMLWVITHVSKTMITKQQYDFVNTCTWNVPVLPILCTRNIMMISFLIYWKYILESHNYNNIFLKFRIWNFISLANPNLATLHIHIGLIDVSSFNRYCHTRHELILNSRGKEKLLLLTADKIRSGPDSGRIPVITDVKYSPFQIKAQN